MNAESCVLDQISRHASVRRYKDQDIPEEHLEAILEAARRAPTAWNLMPIHVSAIRDPALKERAAEAVGGQEHVAKAAVFLVFSVDYDKILGASRQAGVEPGEPGLGHFVAALVDAGIMSGWAALAAESLGYGITFIAVYSNPCGMAEALGLPGGLIPVVGLTIGVPAESPEPRKRQGPQAVYSVDNRVPPVEERAREVARVYGDRAARLFRVVLSPGGYLERVGRAVHECLKKKGYRV